MFFRIKTLFIISLLLGLSLPGWSAPQEVELSEPAKAQLMGFQEWKKVRILEATLALDEVQKDRAEPVASKGEEQATENTQISADSTEPQMSSHEQQLRFNLEIAQNLSIHDYFALYLKDKSKAEMAFVIGKMSPENLSELLSSYRDRLYGTPSPAPLPQAQ